MGPWCHGQQAGLFLYRNDDNYIKLVLEGMKDGGVKVVMAREAHRRAAVLKPKTAPPGDGFAPGSAATDAVTLRLTLGPRRRVCAGAVRGGDAGRWREAGRCDCAFLFEAAGAAAVDAGVGAHGGPGVVAGGGDATPAALAAAGCALFRDFRILSS